MIHLLLKKIRQLYRNFNTGDELDNESTTLEEEQNTTNFKTETLVGALDTSCTKIAIYIREDGEFAITTKFNRSSEEVIDMTGTVLHMINSGLLADYFLKSLQMWTEENSKDNALVLSTIKKWKMLFDEENTMKQTLAIDPSDVFALKSFSKKGSEEI